MSAVLVLNQDFTPISVCSVQRAFLLVFLKKAELLSEKSDAALRSVNECFPFPSVIRVLKYAHIPYKGVVLTRHNVFKRDAFLCQYCGTGKDLTLDHLIPRSKGGKSTWTNLVTACKSCNARKGDYALEQIGMRLSRKPIRPTYVMFLRSTTTEMREDWIPFLDRKVSA